MIDKKNRQIFEALQKRVWKLWETVFNNFSKEMIIKPGSDIKAKLLEVLMKALPKYKQATDEPTRVNLVNILKDNLIEVVGSKEPQMNNIIWNSLVEVFKSVNDIITHSVNTRQLEIWLTQLMTTYSNVLNTNKLKMDNKEIINVIVNTIQEKLDNIWKFWIYGRTKHEYFTDILIIISLSIKVNRFEEEWGLEIVQDLMKDNIERYSSFIPQGMLIEWLEMMSKWEVINTNSYDNIVKQMQKLTESMDI